MLVHECSVCTSYRKPSEPEDFPLMITERPPAFLPEMYIDWSQMKLCSTRWDSWLSCNESKTVWHNVCLSSLVQMASAKARSHLRSSKTPLSEAKVLGAWASILTCDPNVPTYKYAPWTSCYLPHTIQKHWRCDQKRVEGSFLHIAQTALTAPVLFPLNISMCTFAANEHDFTSTVNTLGPKWSLEHNMKKEEGLHTPGPDWFWKKRKERKSFTLQSVSEYKFHQTGSTCFSFLPRLIFHQTSKRPCNFFRAKWDIT